MSKSLNRRSFTVRLLSGAAIPAVAKAGEAPAHPVSSAHAKTRPAANLSATDLIVELVQRKYADPRLDEAALDEIRNDVAMQLRRSAILSSVPLTNADAPAFVIQAFRADNATRREP